jgi:hypothetical protein
MDIIIQLVSQYPALASVLMGVGVLRLIFKPLFTFLRIVADATPTAKDNEILDSVEQSKAYSYVAFILDYLASVKLPEKK